MYLKSIEVQGFKSFANKICFSFQHGVTGIVGPNGSGKSNVGDAVRWVLGEQSAKSLRGGNMQDVIFAGTVNRKPQGFAYVAITLDNADRALSLDYDEVTVSRRLYRSGESEYRLNGSPCRLKDVNELFMDTGIGQEGYSIIGQGQVEKILSGRPEERRELFDEAAGITKFRKRKAAAEKKLQTEHDNLVRVSDILQELSKQVEPLRKQSETAEKYLKLRDEVKALDLNLFLLQSDASRKVLAEIEKRAAILRDEVDRAVGEEEALKRQYESLDRLLEELDSAIAGKRREIEDLRTGRGAAEGRIAVLHEQAKAEQAKVEEIALRRARSEEERRRREEERAALGTQQAEAAAAAEAATARAASAEQERAAADAAVKALEEELQSKKDAVISLINERADMSSRGARYEAMMQEANIRVSKSAQRLLQLKTDFDGIESALQRAEAETKALEDERTAAAAERALRNEKIAESKKAESALLMLLRETQKAYQSNAARLETLQNFTERYEGFGQSVQRVMGVRDRVRGIFGVVADLISVDKRYEQAIEIALGGRMQNIVVDTEETAKQLIEFLKKNRYGRATFLPQSAQHPRPFDPGAVLKEPGVLGIAASLVRTDERYRVVIENLIGRDIVVDTIDHAIAISKKYRQSYRLVTLEGDQLNPGGSMTGGTFRNNSNLLSRRREIEELRQAQEKLVSRNEAEEKELKELRETLRLATEALQALSEREHEVSLNLNRAELSRQTLREKKEELEVQLRELGTERREITSSLEALEMNRGSLQGDLQSLAEKQREAEAEIRRLQDLLDEKRKAYSAVLAQQSETAVAASLAGEQQRHLRENLRRVADEVARYAAEVEALERESEAARQAAAEKQRSAAEEEKALTGLEATLKTLEGELEALETEKSNHSGEQKKRFEKRDEITARRTELEKDLFRVNAQRDKETEQRDAQCAYILSEYNLTEEGARQYRDPSFGDMQETRRTIREKKDAMRALGNVNVNAIEDYKEVSERHNFLSAQCEDLQRAEDALRKVIEELDIGMRKRFAEGFRSIQRAFNQVFRELFGGGKGELRLEEGVDLLDAGIAIIAEPPGKKLQNMMQLSGGEKALTAIALLFAIQNLKPSPFALLDEIEAALDDSNVDRYAQYLKKLAKNTQFIVITHRRGTMVAADRLYGITMQEKGVSALVSVSLIEDQLDK